MTDPRYDPRYQRGWDGAPPPPSTPSEPPIRSSRTPTPTSTLTPAREQPAVDERPSPPPPAAPVSAPAAPERPDSQEDEPPARNPFLLVLLVLGGVAVVAAAGMLWQLTRPVSSSDPAAFIGPQIESEVAPWLLLAGLLCVIAAISVRAVRRR